MPETALAHASEVNMTNNGKRRLLVIIIIAVMALMIILPSIAMIISYAQGATSEQIQGQIDALKEQAASIDDQMDQLQEKLQEVGSKEQSVSEQKLAQDKQIELTRQEIENTVAQIQQYGLLIASKQAELDKALEEKELRQEQLKSRLRAMEENGSVSYISIIFQANSFSDLLDRIEMVRDLMSYDQNVLDSLTAAQEKIDAARERLEENKGSMNASKSLLEEQERQLAEQLAQSDRTLLALHEEKQAYTEEYNSVQEQEEALWENINKLVDQYNQVKAEEEEIARQAAIAAAKKAAEKNNSSYNYDSNSDGSFAWPVDCYTITSVYGMRYHPVLGVYKLHTGVDVGASYGKAITSAKSGWVAVAEYSYAYGNYVVISHGDGVSTLYAHMSSIAVNSGDYVLQGSTLGYVGSTGYSTGAHLHYEIRESGVYKNPLSYYNLDFYID